jgi:hypothetical protein
VKEALRRLLALRVARFLERAPDPAKGPGARLLEVTAATTTEIVFPSDFSERAMVRREGEGAVLQDPEMVGQLWVALRAAAAVGWPAASSFSCAHAGPGARAGIVDDDGGSDAGACQRAAVAYRTPVKTRILAGGIHSAKQQVVRIDRYSGEKVSDAHRKAAETAAKRAIKTADAVLISDYGSGLVQPRFVAELAASINGRIPILIDSRYALTKYRGLTACTPNESEVEQVLGVTIDDSKRVLEKAGYVKEGLMRHSAVKEGQLLDQLLYAAYSPSVSA